MLLDWSKWKNLIEFQKKIFQEQNLDEKLYPVYLNNWEIDLVVGPEKVEKLFTFKNLKQNEFKPFLLAELKVLEETPIPKWIKTPLDNDFDMELDSMFEAELYDITDDNSAKTNEEIKNIYIKNGRYLDN